MNTASTPKILKNSYKKRSIIVDYSLIIVIFSTFVLSYLPGGNVINKYIGMGFALIVLFNFVGRGKKLYIGSELILLYLWCLYGLFISIYAKNSTASLYKSITMFQLAILMMCSISAIKWSKNIKFFLPTLS